MRIDGFSQPNSIILSDVQDILAKLNIGDTVRAQLIDFLGNDLLLKLFDGTTFKAATMVPIEAKLGDFLDFVVNNKIEKQVFLETVKNPSVKSASAENEIRQILTSLDIKPDRKSVDVAKQLRSNDLPFSKEILSKAVDIGTKFAGIKPDKAVFLASNGINIEERNIEALNQIVEGRFKVGKGLEELVETVLKSCDEALLKNIARDLSLYDNLKDASQLPNTDSIRNNQNSVTILNSNAPEDPVPVKTSELKDEPVHTDNKAQVDISNGVTDLKDSKIRPLPKETLSEIVRVINNEIANNKDKSVGHALKSVNTPVRLTVFLNSQIKNGENTLDKIVGFFMDEASRFDKPETGNLSDFFKALAFKLKKDFSPGPPGRNMPIQPDEPMTAEKAKALIKKAFDDVYIKVDQGDGKKDLNLKGAYRDAYEKVEILKHNLNLANLAGRDDIARQADNLQNNMRFINEINAHSSYVQIPLSLRNRNTTGELYILKRDSRKKRIDPEDVTVFLSLDTENLGQIDSLIGINRKNVTVNFRVEDQRIFDLIREKHKELYNSLASKGFKLVDLKYRMIEEHVDIVNVNRTVGLEARRNRLSVDFRI